MLRFVIIMLVVGVCLACGMPQDPEKTLDRIAGARLRVGISEATPWVYVQENRPQGIEVQLVERLAKQFDARIEWVSGPESKLMELLEQGRIDVVIAGLTDSAPWSERVGLSRPYAEVQDVQSGKTHKHVWAVRQGENRWLLELDRFLQKQRSLAARLLREVAA